MIDSKSSGAASSDLAAETFRSGGTFVTAPLALKWDRLERLGLGGPSTRSDCPMVTGRPLPASGRMGR